MSGLLASGDPMTIKYAIFFAETTNKTRTTKKSPSATLLEPKMEKLPYDQTVRILLAVAREYIQGEG